MSYNLLRPIQVITNGDMSTATIISEPVEIKLQDNVGVQLDWVGSPVGNFSVQVSMDFNKDIEGNITNAGHWITVPLNPTIAAAGTPDNAYADLNQLSAQYIRVVYTKTSGTGTLNAFVCAKGV